MKKRFVVLGLLLLCLGGKAQDAYVIWKPGKNFRIVNSVFFYIGGCIVCWLRENG